jgi:hypothetical protein
VTVILTRDAVVQAGPCSDGMVIWDKYLAGGDAHATGGWSRDVQILALHTPLRRYLGWAWGKGLLPMWSMASVDLHAADLRRANLRAADLGEANLHAADLRRADLRWADLRGADLRGTNLSRANLSRANLSGADLR